MFTGVRPSLDPDLDRGEGSRDGRPSAGGSRPAVSLESLPALDTLPAPSLHDVVLKPRPGGELGGSGSSASGNRLVVAGLGQDDLELRGPLVECFAGQLARTLGLEPVRGPLEGGPDLDEPGVRVQRKFSLSARRPTRPAVVAPRSASRHR